MSDSVSIKYNADAGRHGIAEQKINPGIPHNTIVTLREGIQKKIDFF